MRNEVLGDSSEIASIREYMTLEKVHYNGF